MRLSVVLRVLLLWNNPAWHHAHGRHDAMMMVAKVPVPGLPVYLVVNGVIYI